MTSTIRKTIYILYAVLLINSCHCGRQTYKGSEVVLFLGEIGAGKSTLCNSIFQQVVFKSGVNIIPLGGNMGVTTNKQEYIYENKLYIDTPGIDLFDATKREQTAKVIEEALKHNNNYKIVFVVRYIDKNYYNNAKVINMIDKVCNTIQTNFEYGIIFNQVPKRLIQVMSQQGVDQEKLHEAPYMPIKPLKAPFLTVVLEEDGALKGEDNKYFQVNNENRKKLLNFLNKLNAHKIAPNEVGKMDISKL